MNATLETQMQPAGCLQEMVSPLVEMPSGLFIPETLAEELALAQRRETGVDVFAGAGGFSLGFIQAGFQVVCAVENSPVCIITYMCNLCRWGQVKIHFIEPRDEARLERELQNEFRRNDKSRRQFDLPLAGTGWIATQPAETPSVSNIIMGDVRKLTGKRLLEILDMERGELGCMFGGPPCQGFTYANAKRHAGDARNGLVFEFARLIVETMPQTIVMENVPGILTMKTEAGVPVVERFCKILKDGGFHGVDAFESRLRSPTAVGALRTEKKRKRANDKAH
jgi:DNA (cytosine-5)-methyltransferase 1